MRRFDALPFTEKGSERQRKFVSGLTVSGTMTSFATMLPFQPFFDESVRVVVLSIARHEPAAISPSSQLMRSRWNAGAFGCPPRLFFMRSGTSGFGAFPKPATMTSNHGCAVCFAHRL